MELEAAPRGQQVPSPPATVSVRRTWRWGRLGSTPEWGVLLRGQDGREHVVTAATPEAVGLAVAAHLTTLHAAQDAAA